MEKVWPWITTSLPYSSPSHWPEPPPSLVLAAHADKSISLHAELTTTTGSGGGEASSSVLFSISLHGFDPSNPKTLWTSNPFPLSTSSLTPCLFLSQLLREIISLQSPPQSTFGFDVVAISEAVDGEPTAPAFFALALLCRLFWLCAAGGEGVPAEAGFLFFRSVGPADLGRALGCRPALRRFLPALGPDLEERFMRSLGYVTAKWCILRELQQPSAPAAAYDFCPSYVADAHGLWVLRGYAPVSAMPRSAVVRGNSGGFDVKDSVLRYALAHQQLEAVIQLEYTVSMRDPRYIGVCVRVDNIRLHVVRLGLVVRNDDEEAFGPLTESNNNSSMRGERHFPSRVRVWAGPELGSAYATGLSLGRSTVNPERETESTQSIKGRVGPASKSLKARANASVRSRGKDWRWEQEAEGNTAVFEGVLCEGTTGAEVAVGPGGGGAQMMRKGRYNSGVGRALSKNGGLVVSGEEDGMGKGVRWRVGREMEGKVLRWRVGGKVWVSYCANEVKTEYFETRCVEWTEEVDLHLAACCDNM